MSGRGKLTSFGRMTRYSETARRPGLPAELAFDNSE
jgi:hypothetical protein